MHVTTIEKISRDNLCEPRTFLKFETVSSLFLEYFLSYGFDEFRKITFIQT